MCREEPRPRLELADIVRAHTDLLDRLRPEQARVSRAIARCRTAALGGHVRACSRCGHREIAYNSCRDRHCPKCQGLEAARWLSARERDLLPVPYHHTVFTVPHVLHPLFRAAPRFAFAHLFAAAAETLLEVARNPRHLGAEIGFTAVLHTWTQKLEFHPHVHVVATGGGLDPTRSRWIATRPGFFLPVRVLSRVFRGKLLERLERALRRGRIVCREGQRLLRRSTRTDWVVYSKPPFAGPEQVLRYLSRYTHKIAISNERLLSFDGRSVTFRWKDRRQGDRKRTLMLPAEDFLRRFFTHVLPKGFVRIRHYGLLANGAREERLARCRRLLGAPEPLRAEEPSWEDLVFDLTGRDPRRCPVCGEGRLLDIEPIPPTPRPRGPP